MTHIGIQVRITPGIKQQPKVTVSSYQHQNCKYCLNTETFLIASDQEYFNNCPSFDSQTTITKKVFFLTGGIIFLQFNKTKIFMLKLVNISKFSGCCIIYKFLVKHWGLNITILNCGIILVQKLQMIVLEAEREKKAITLFSPLAHPNLENLL